MSFQLKSASSGAFDPVGPFYPVGLDPTKKFFVDQFNRPCFMLGEDGAELPVAVSKSDIEIYLSDRASRGFNLIWIQATENIIGASPPQNINGDVPYSGSDFTNETAAYWNYVEYVVQRCAAYGITALVNPNFMGLDGSSGYQVTWKAASDSVLQAYAIYLAGRFGPYKNLIWLLGGDSDPADTALYAKLHTFALALKAADPNHLITFEASRFTGGSPAPNGGYSAVEGLMLGLSLGAPPSWLDVNWVYQTAATCLSGAQRCYLQSGLPNIMGEDWYENDTHAMTPLGLRTEAYGAIFGGCTLGRISGNGPIWSFNLSGGGSTSPSWKTQLNSPGSVAQQLLGKLLRSVQHQLLVPDKSNVVMTTGAANGSACARDSQGKSILIYMPSNQEVAVDMTKITDAANLANAFWFDVTNGVATSAGSGLSTTGSRNFTLSGNNAFGDPDMALIINGASSGLRTPGT